MCVYIHVYLYTYVVESVSLRGIHKMFVRVHEYMGMCACICTYVFVNMYMYMCICTSRRMVVREVGKNIRVHVLEYMYIYTNICTYTRIYVYSCTRMSVNAKYASRALSHVT